MVLLYVGCWEGTIRKIESFHNKCLRFTLGVELNRGLDTLPRSGLCLGWKRCNERFALLTILLG